MRLYRYTGKKSVLPDWTIEKENIWNEDEFRVDDVSFDMSEIAKFLFFQLMFWGCPQKKNICWVFNPNNFDAFELNCPCLWAPGLPMPPGTTWRLKQECRKNNDEKIVEQYRNFNILLLSHVHWFIPFSLFYSICFVYIPLSLLLLIFIDRYYMVLHCCKLINKIFNISMRSALKCL
jgi:hypothetical protein